MIGTHVKLINSKTGEKHLLRFVGDPIPSRCVYRNGSPSRIVVVDPPEKLDDMGIRIYREAVAICLDVHSNELLIVVLPEPIVLTVQRFVQSGGGDPGSNSSRSFLVSVTSGDPITFNIAVQAPHNLEGDVRIRAAELTKEMQELAIEGQATIDEIAKMHKDGCLVSPYRSEDDVWMEPADVVELMKDMEPQDRVLLYEKFLTYVSECCDDTDVAMIAGILCRTKEK